LVKECRNAVKNAVILVECGKKFDLSKTCNIAGFPRKVRWNVRNVVCSYVCCCFDLSEARSLIVYSFHSVPQSFTVCHRVSQCVIIVSQCVTVCHRMFVYVLFMYVRMYMCANVVFPFFWAHTRMRLFPDRNVVRSVQKKYQKNML